MLPQSPQVLKLELLDKLFALDRDVSFQLEKLFGAHSELKIFDCSTEVGKKYCVLQHGSARLRKIAAAMAGFALL